MEKRLMAALKALNIPAKFTPAENEMTDSEIEILSDPARRHIQIGGGYWCVNRSEGDVDAGNFKVIFGREQGTSPTPDNVRKALAAMRTPGIDPIIRERMDKGRAIAEAFTDRIYNADELVALLQDCKRLIECMTIRSWPPGHELKRKTLKRLNRLLAPVVLDTGRPTDKAERRSQP